MFCKYCGTQLPDDSTVCVNCGKDTEEQVAVQAQLQPEAETAQPAQKKKNKRLKLVLAITAGVVMFALLVGIVFASFNGGLVPRENNVYYKDSYTAADWWVGLNGNAVVATIGEHKLTNRQLQVYYWMQVYEFLNTNSAYLSQYGLDVTKPLDKQVYNTSSGVTWQQVFLEDALGNWQRCTALAEEAKKNGYKLDAQYEEFLSGMQAQMEQNAQKEGYASLEEMLENDMGPGVTYDEYYSYLSNYYTGNLYFQYLRGQIKVTDAELEEFFKANETALKENYKITKTSGKLVDVRHILIMPKGGTLSEDGKTTVYSDAEWETCRVEAQKILDEWLAGDKSESSFATLAAEHSADGSAEDGGLLQEIALDTMVKEFEDWCFDETRKTGDYGLVKTQFGYHVMYYVDGDEGWIRYCTDGLMSQKSNEILLNMEKSYPSEINYKKVVLGSVELN